MAPRSSMDLDELVEYWTVLDDERALVDAKHGASRLGFAVLLKHYTRHGWFPTGRADLPDVGIEFVARQLQLSAVHIDAYEWVGRSIERHRAQIRQHLGFRECSVADAEQLTAWLAEHVAERERRPERVRDGLLARCRGEQIEPPAPAQIERIVRSALHASEEALAARVTFRSSAACRHMEGPRVGFALQMGGFAVTAVEKR